MSLLESRMRELIVPLQRDIFKYAHAMGVDLTPQQIEILKPVQRGDKRIAAKSGNGIGKTTSTCLAGSWRAFKAVDALTIVTAPTMDQCRGVWLTEFGRILEQRCRMPLLKKLFNVTKSCVTIGGRDKWSIRFRTATKPENFQGIHETNLTIVVEEGSGIDGAILEAVDGCLTNQNSMNLVVGNPNTRECRFFDFFNKDRGLWTTMTFSSEDSPLTSKESIQHIINTYGKDSDVYRVRVLGEFPNMDPNCIISMETLEKCTKTSLIDAARQPRNYNGKCRPAKQIGIDYARHGDDETVVIERFGNAMLKMEFFSKVEPRHTNRYAMRRQIENGWSDEETVYAADANGLGDGVMIDFPEAGRYVHEFKAQHSAAKRGEFGNKITEAWFDFARRCREGVVHLKYDEKLFQQLSTRMYKFNTKGQIVIEPKDVYKKRTKRESPDRADALCMAFYDEVEADTQVLGATLAQVKRFGTGR